MIKEEKAYGKIGMIIFFCNHHVILQGMWWSTKINLMSQQILYPRIYFGKVGHNDMITYKSISSICTNNMKLSMLIMSCNMFLFKRKCLDKIPYAT